MWFVAEADSEVELQEVLGGLPLFGIAHTKATLLGDLEELRDSDGH
jgi:hypothetical protein